MAGQDRRLLLSHRGEWITWKQNPTPRADPAPGAGTLWLHHTRGTIPFLINITMCHVRGPAWSLMRYPALPSIPKHEDVSSPSLTRKAFQCIPTVLDGTVNSLVLGSVHTHSNASPGNWWVTEPQKRIFTASGQLSIAPRWSHRLHTVCSCPSSLSMCDAAGFSFS